MGAPTALNTNTLAIAQGLASQGLQVLPARPINQFNCDPNACPSGHAYTPENTIRNAAGHRFCRACKNGHQARKRESDKKAAFDFYGWACQCCGEDEPRFLVIDHVNDDGNVHRRTTNYRNLYNWLRINDYPPDDFQTLCHNCNFAKSTGGCPHAG